MARLPLALMALLLMAFSPARADPTETEQRAACLGDALRLCARFIPNREAIRLCLAGQHESLSPGCRPVFDASMRALDRATRQRH